MLEPSYRPLTALGLLLIACGVVLVTLPLITRHLPSLERLPWILVWVYRRDGFYFITSPLLIIISILSLAIRLLGRGA
ncbi:hypothetical protein AC482_03250 [miscellaneous Crenarchaeota group-15 archaeon DG-45]|uniref:DUF2905 domain-containing protein n=1 Tax=miscellaneous Crenarchaeota group-15 archaeon DG-45 TaxID=1685127 RepID=A0A0M0BQF2_9ARCH|nr:MAG: hypothetical protein AC482_03250 [miscellaneous Crenarchaeota group-15 archaeon DG-45]